MFPVESEMFLPHGRTYSLPGQVLQEQLGNTKLVHRTHRSENHIESFSSLLSTVTVRMPIGGLSEQSKAPLLLVASLLLVAMPGDPSSVRAPVVRPGAPSSNPRHL